MSYPRTWQYFPMMERGHGSTRPNAIVSGGHQVLPAKRCAYPGCIGETDERHRLNPLAQAHEWEEQGRNRNNGRV